MIKIGERIMGRMLAPGDRDALSGAWRGML